MGDSVAEMRTMILLSLPFPPLPIRVEKTDSLELSARGEDRDTTSHTLIAKVLNDAAERNDQGANARRNKRQMEVFQRFLHALGGGGFDADAKGLFTLYCDYTRLHIHTYFENAPPPPIFFGRCEDVARGSPVHLKMCEYMAGQSILFGDKPPVARREYERKSYGSLLLMARARLGRMEDSPENEAELEAELEAEPKPEAQPKPEA